MRGVFSFRVRAAGTSAVGSKAKRRRSVDRLQIVGGHLPAALIRHEIELDFLAFDEVTEAGALHGADMDEGILAAVIGLNEAEALGRIKPLNGSRRHEENPFTA